MATTFSKLLLSNSTNGKQIPVFTTGSPGTTLHISSFDSSSLDEIYIYATNNNTSNITASLLWGNTGSADTINTILPPFSGRVLITDGRLLSNGLAVNAYSVGGTASFDGFVNRISQVSAVSGIVSQWSTRVSASSGLIPSASTISALTTFVQSLETNGLLDKMYSINCFVPDSLTATLIPLYQIAGNNPWTNTAFVSGDLTVNGLKGDASGKWLDTGFLGTNFPNNNSAGITMYCYSTASSGQYDNGYTSNAGDQAFLLTSHFGGNNIFMGQIWENSAGGTVEFVSQSANIISPSTGSYMSVNRLASNELRLYLGNSQFPHTASLLNTITRTAVPVNTSVYVFAIHAFNSGALPFGLTNSRISFFALHAGLTPNQSQLFFNAVQKLRQDLGGGFI